MRHWLYELIGMRTGPRTCAMFWLGEDDIVRFEDNYGRKGTNT